MKRKKSDFEILVGLICKMEGLKQQTQIAQVRECIACLFALEREIVTQATFSEANRNTLPLRSHDLDKISATCSRSHGKRAEEVLEEWRTAAKRTKKRKQAKA